MEKHWVAWFEIPVIDLERAVAFYETIFDIKIQIENFGEFKMGILPHGTSGGALVQYAESYKPSATHGPLLYLNAGDDLLQVSDKVKVAGGQISMDKKQISMNMGLWQ